ncbi:DJ-1/PfpI family protein [Hyphomicrobiales bacterium BP6-180914]|uniref:DJ-1/PfpI family protein n=1 Tax=Lichenifustis flavocetrariae TaxID=2949735 RepID=A0AA41YTK8_9HYPH|nr:DJ-1/PfpI family protein [Lichenifustis flavocetrariae]
MLINAGAVEGKTLTSWPSLQADPRNAGATWLDREVERDGNLVTSRNPKTSPAFCKAVVELFGQSA